MAGRAPRSPIRAAAAGLGLALTPGQYELLDQYVRLIEEWRPRVRLTGVRSDAAVTALVAGSLCVLPFIPESGRLADLGSGGGVLGVPVASLRPALRVVLTESAHKKAAFLSLVVRTLGLTNVEVEAMRAEDLGRDSVHRGRYDAVTARALAPVRVLVEYALPLLRIGGAAVLPKGRGGADEVRAAARALRLLGGEAAVRPAPAECCSPIVLVRKTVSTPEVYPRRPGLPVRRPL